MQQSGMRQNEADTAAQTRTRAKMRAERQFLCSELWGGTMLYSSFCLVYYYMLYIVGDVTELVGYGCDRAVTNLEMMNRNEKGWNLVLIW